MNTLRQPSMRAFAAVFAGFLPGTAMRAHVDCGLCPSSSASVTGCRNVVQAVATVHASLLGSDLSQLDETFHSGVIGGELAELAAAQATDAAVADGGDERGRSFCTSEGTAPDARAIRAPGPHRGLASEGGARAEASRCGSLKPGPPGTTGARRIRGSTPSGGHGARSRAGRC